MTTIAEALDDLMPRTARAERAREYLDRVERDLQMDTGLAPQLTARMCELRGATNRLQARLKIAERVRR